METHNHLVDPKRFPKIQDKIEKEVKRNFESTLKSIKIQIIKVLKNKELYE